MLARTETLPPGDRAPARDVAAGARALAVAGLVVGGAFLPLSMDVPQYALVACVVAIATARRAGRLPPRVTALDAPAWLVGACAVTALAIALATGRPLPGLEEATRFRAAVAPPVILAALALASRPGDRSAAPLAVLLAWCAAALAACGVGLAQAIGGVDLLHAIGLRGTPRLPVIPGWPGHVAPTGFFTGYARFAQSLMPPLFLCAALALLAPLARRTRVVLGGTAAVAAVAVVLTAMRAGWASLAAGAGVLLLLAGGRTLRLGLPAAAGALALALLHPGQRGRLAAALSGATNGDRETIWTVCAAVRDDFPLGLGPGNFGAFAPGYWARLAPGQAVGSGCHSVPLDLLVEGGPLLLAGWLVAAVLVVRALWRLRRTADPLGRAATAGALAGLASLAAAAPVHDVHRAMQTAFALAFTVALAAALAAPARVAPREGRLPRAAPLQ